MASLPIRWARAAMLLAMVLTTCWARSARADEDAGSAPRLAIHVEGRNAASLRQAIVDAVPSGVELIDAGDFDLAMRRAGLPPVLGRAIQNKAARKLLLKGIGKALDKTGAAAALLARELPGKRQLFALYCPKGADEADEETIDLGADAAGAVKKTLGSIFASLAPKPPTVQEVPPEKTEEEKQKEREEAEQKARAFKPSVPGGELFNVRAGIEIGGRFFRYSDPLTANAQRDYKIMGPPAVAVGAEIYPAATTRIIVLRDLGVTFDFAQFLGLKSQTADVPPRTFGGSWNRLDVGLRYRFRFGAADKPLVVGLSGGYGFEHFVFNPDDAAAATIANELASVKYQYLRIGADARLPVAFVAFIPWFSYLGPLGVGGGFAETPPPPGSTNTDLLYDRFRGASVKAIDLGLDIAFVLPKGFELKGGVDYTRLFASFDPQPGDAYVAGGALDQFLALRFFALYRY